MSPDVTLTLAAVFVAVALLTGSITAYLLSQMSPGRRRLGQVLQPAAVTGILLDSTPRTTSRLVDRIVKVLPNANSEHLRRQMQLAGFHDSGALAIYAIGEFVLPLLLAVPAFLLLDPPAKVLATISGLGLGYMTPGLLLKRRTAARQLEIQKGLADALDLLVLCLEAGTSLDQAIVKAGEELEIAYPALADQLRIVISETRAGKTRLEAFRGFAKRTQVDDVRALVAMLAQTDRFGTSVAQALRTHADVCRTKRRQQAEERAGKVGVKLVFPLVFLLFPAFYVVMLGPAFIRLIQVFGSL